MNSEKYSGACSICGEKGEFARGEQRSIRESYPCPSCRFTLRWRDQAAIILDEFGRGQALSLTQLVNNRHLDRIDIFEPALRGPFVQRFQELPKYVQGYFWPEVEKGVINNNGVRNEDLTDLSFQDDCLDLFITSDVMEHLYDIEKAFSEIHRVLKPGGIHVFTIPNTAPFPDTTIKRVKIEHDGTLAHLKPAHYHNSGDGSKCLVYTDYGADIVDMIDQFGSTTSVVRRSSALSTSIQNATFVTRKLAGSGGRRPPKPSFPVKKSSSELQCPICSGMVFEAFNGRTNARCSSCRAVERNRLMWMLLEEKGAFEPELRTMHFSPEYGLAKKLHELSGEKYFACDFDPQRYESKLFTVHEINMCTDLSDIPDASYDLILHNHVLEHVACDVHSVMNELYRILAPSGKHFFSVPIRGQITAEDMSEDLTDTHRLMRFGQEDHFRIFGTKSLKDMLRDIWGEGQYVLEPLALLGEDKLRRAAIPHSAWTGISSHSIFGMTKLK